MKNILKRTLAVLLTAVMLLSAAPIAALAAKSDGSDKTEAGTEAEFADDTGMGKIINNLAETNSDDANEDYSITDVTVSGKIATVTFSTVSNCKVVVAVYDESTEQMLASGMTDITADEAMVDSKTEVKIQTETMPEYYLIKAFLIDGDLAALTNSYSYYEHTKAYEKFINTTPEDFDEDKVLPLSEDKQADFGALNDNVVNAETSASMTVDYDSDTGVYTFNNAIDEVKKLTVGKTFFYQLSDTYDDFILLKVKSISVNGTTVKITEDSDISLEDAFEYVRVDESADFSNISNDDIETSDCIDVDQSAESESINSTEVNENGTVNKSESDEEHGDEHEEGKTFSSNFKVNYPKKESDDKKAWASGVKLTGSINYTLTSSVRLHWDARFGPDYYEFKTEIKNTFNIDFSISGTIALNPDKVCFNILGKKGIPISVFRLYIKVYPILEATLKIDSLKINIVSVSTTSFNSSDGLNKDTKTTKSLKDSEIAEAEIDIKVGIGVEFELGRKAGKKDKNGKENILATVSVKFEGYFTVTLKPFNVVHTALDVHHDCIYCATGILDGTISGTLSLNLKLFKFVDTSVDLVSLDKKWTLGKAYFSISSHGIKFAMGECPYIQKGVTVIVLNNSESKNKLEGAVVTSKTGYCCADNDGKYNDRSYPTGSDGTAKFYFCTGKHKLAIKYNGTTKYTNINVSINDEELTFYFDSGTTNGSLSDGTGSDDSIFTGNETTGTVINFGSYPQSEVTDTSLAARLKSQPKEWISYDYYTGTGDKTDGNMTASDYMKYSDFMYKGTKYRAVTFSQYRPYCTGYTSSSSYSNQYYNGYIPGQIYYFKYEPLQWRVLDPATGYIMCNSIIDSQAYQNYVYENGSQYYNSKACTNYASDWATSSIRAWLNNDFYNTAFTAEEQSAILSTNNVTQSTYGRKYDSANTTDKVFLISYYNALNTAYGFSSSYDNSSTRTMKGSAYAKCQGLWVYHSSGDSYNGNSWWLLRSPSYSVYAEYVNLFGDLNNQGVVWYTAYGVVPALKISNLTAVSSKAATAKGAKQAAKASKKPLRAAQNFAAAGTVTCSGAVNGNLYMVYAVSAYTAGCGITADNLYYINQSSGENGEVKFDCKPKQGENLTIIVVGDFGSGTETKVVEIKQTNVTAVTIDDFAMNYKSAITLTPKITADEGAQYTVKWESSNPKAATVDEKGKVTATGTGTSTITCTVTDKNGNTVKDTATVKVTLTWWQWLIKILLFGWIWY